MLYLKLSLSKNGDKQLQIFMGLIAIIIHFEGLKIITKMFIVAIWE
jgi:type IV secretory pathway TrbD component